MPKIIDVANGYAISFTERARGQESPYWVGVIYKDGEAVGRFRNSGNGGSTLVTPHQVQKDLEALVEGVAPEGADLFEHSAIPIVFAEAKGYARGKSRLTADFKAFVADWLATMEG